MIGPYAESEFIDIFQFTEIAYPSYEIIEAYERNAQYTGFRRHSLAVADVYVCESHDVMHVNWLDVDAIWLKLRFERPF